MDEKVKATVSAAVVLAVSLASMYGITLDGDIITQILLVVLDAAVVVYACWKNHNWTDAAVKAQQYLDRLKDAENDED